MSDEGESIALLIDTENIQPREYEAVKVDLLKRGRIIVKRAYGEFSQESSDAERRTLRRRWNDILALDKVKRVNPASNVRGKNACDILLVIEAMDLLSNPAIKTFAIVSSDSDFGPLVDRLREAGKRVLGYGSRLTASSFRTSVDVFTTFDALLPTVPVQQELKELDESRVFGRICQRNSNDGVFTVESEKDGARALVRRSEAKLLEWTSVGMRVSYKLRFSLRHSGKMPEAHGLKLEDNDVDMQVFSGYVSYLSAKYGFISLSDGNAEKDVFVDSVDFPANIAVGLDVTFCYRQRGPKPVACEVKVVSDPTTTHDDVRQDDVQHDAIGQTPTEKDSARVPCETQALKECKQRMEAAFDTLLADSCDGWVRLRDAMRFLRRRHPDFDVRPLAYRNVTQFLQWQFAHTYEVIEEGTVLWIRHAETLPSEVSAPVVTEVAVGQQRFYNDGSKFICVTVVKKRRLGAFNVKKLDGTILYKINAADLHADRPQHAKRNQEVDTDLNLRGPHKRRRVN
eukprot:TRINITY_DN18125_c0_g1_i1.p1 TRINITY_DN18125_c0_g1~~TRINITY_DN18125_c0_g1_i1.p1  ORF type:complete len:513 (-),score=55.98 TRINITY_DN18125_c0_g1_i1:47-1585(-)